VPIRLVDMLVLLPRGMGLVIDWGRCSDVRCVVEMEVEVEVEGVEGGAETLTLTGRATVMSRSQPITHLCTVLSRPADQHGCATAQGGRDPVKRYATFTPSREVIRSAASRQQTLRAEKLMAGCSPKVRGNQNKRCAFSPPRGSNSQPSDGLIRV
jgi:hypothetical protein